MFAVEHYGLEPDIMTGRQGAISGGVGSLAVVLATDERVAESYFAGTTRDERRATRYQPPPVSAMIDTMVSQSKTH